MKDDAFFLHIVIASVRARVKLLFSLFAKQFRYSSEC